MQTLLTYKIIESYSFLEQVIMKYLEDISTETDVYVYHKGAKDIKLFDEFERAICIIKHPNERKLRHLFLAHFHFFRSIRNSLVHNDGDATKDVRYYAVRNANLLKVNKFGKVVIKKNYIDFIHCKILEFGKLYTFHKGKIIDIKNNRATTVNSLTEEESMQVFNDFKKLWPDFFEEEDFKRI